MKPSAALLLATALVLVLAASALAAPTTQPDPRESNLRNLYNAYLLYAQDHRGVCAPDIASLADPTYSKPPYFILPDSATKPPTDLTASNQSAWVAAHSDYIYIPRNFNAPAEAILIYENQTNPTAPIEVVLLDGAVKQFTPDQLHQRIPSSAAHARAKSVSESDNRVQCARNLRQIGQALLLYSNENRGAYAPSLGILVNTEDITLNTLVCPSTGNLPPAGLSPDDTAKWADAHSDYIYIGAGLKMGADPQIAIAYDKENNHGNDGINILFADGHVDFLNPTAAKAALETSEKLRGGK